MTLYNSNGVQITTNLADPINLNSLPNFRIDGITTDTVLKLCTNTIGKNGFIVFTNATSKISFEWYFDTSALSDNKKTVNIMTNNTLEPHVSLPLPSGNYIFKYYVVNSNILVLWDISLINEAVDGSSLETTGSITLNSNVFVYTTSNLNVPVPANVNCFTAYVWSGGTTTRPGSYTQSTITLPQKSTGSENISITVGEANNISQITYNSKILLKSGLGYNICGNVDGNIETVFGNNEYSFIGSTVDIYGGSNGGYYTYDATNFNVNNYDYGENYDELRYDPYSNCVYQYTRSFNFSGADTSIANSDLVDKSANYYYFTEGTTFGHTNKEGLVVIKFNYADTTGKGINSFTKGENNLTVEQSGGITTDKLLIFKETYGNVELTSIDVTSNQQNILFTSLSNNSNIDVSKFHAILSDSTKQILYGDIKTVGTPTIVETNDVANYKDIVFIKSTVENENNFVIKHSLVNISPASGNYLVVKNTEGTYENAMLRINFEAGFTHDLTFLITSAKYDLYFFNGSWVVMRYEPATSIAGSTYIIVSNMTEDNFPYIPPKIATKFDNLQLRVTFDSSDYIKYGTPLTLTNTIAITAADAIERSTSAIKTTSNSNEFSINNFYYNTPYAITFWFKSTITGSWVDRWIAIISTNYYGLNNVTAYGGWRLYLDLYYGEIQILNNKSGVSHKTGVFYNQIYSKWVLCVLSTSFLKLKSIDGTIDYEIDLSNHGSMSIYKNGSVDPVVHLGGYGDPSPETPFYYDDIRVYNTALTSSELEDIYNENSFISRRATITNLEMTFDGFRTIRLTPSGFNLVDGWGYVLEYSNTKDGTFAVVTGGSGTTTDYYIDITISTSGYYRAGAGRADYYSSSELYIGYVPSSSTIQMTDAMKIRYTFEPGPDDIGTTSNYTQVVKAISPKNITDGDITAFTHYGFFNGTSYAVIDNPGITNNNFSVSFWVYAKSDGGSKTLFASDGYSLINGSFVFYYQQSSIACYFKHSDGIVKTMYTHNIALSQNEWYHFAFNYKTFKLYVNGNAISLVTTGTTDTTTFTIDPGYNTTQKIIIGANNYSDIGEPYHYKFNGYIADFRIYDNYELTLDNAVALYNNTEANDPGTSNLAIRYTFEPGSDDVTDGAAYTDNSTHNTSVVKQGTQSGKFDNNTSVLIFSDYLIPAIYTVSFWYRPSSNSADANGLFATTTNIETDVGYDKEGVYCVRKEENRMYIFYGTGTSYSQTVVSSVFSDLSKWYHIVFVNPGTGYSATMYINNTPYDIGSGSGNTIDTSISTHRMQFGRTINANLGEHYMDDIRVYEKVLSAHEVALLYKSSDYFSEKNKVSPIFTNANTIVTNSDWPSNGWEVSASSETSGTNGWHIFGGTTISATEYLNTWLSNTTDSIHYVTIKYPYSVLTTGYRILNRDYADYALKGWSFKASIDNINYVTLDTKTGLTTTEFPLSGNWISGSGYSSESWYSVDLNVSTTYKYFRVEISGTDRNNGNGATVEELEIFTKEYLDLDMNTLTSVKLDFDGYKTLKITPTGTNLDKGWGYKLLSSTSATGTFTAVSNSLDPTNDDVIPDQVQGTITTSNVQELELTDESASSTLYFKVIAQGTTSGSPALESNVIQVLKVSVFATLPIDVGMNTPSGYQFNLISSSNAQVPSKPAINTNYRSSLSTISSTTTLKFFYKPDFTNHNGGQINPIFQTSDYTVSGSGNSGFAFWSVKPNSSSTFYIYGLYRESGAITIHSFNSSNSDSLSLDPAKWHEIIITNFSSDTTVSINGINLSKTENSSSTQTLGTYQKIEYGITYQGNGTYYLDGAGSFINEVSMTFQSTPPSPEIRYTFGDTTHTSFGSAPTLNEVSIDAVTVKTGSTFKGGTFNGLNATNGDFTSVSYLTFDDYVVPSNKDLTISLWMKPDNTTYKNVLSMSSISSDVYYYLFIHWYDASNGGPKFQMWSGINGSEVRLGTDFAVSSNTWYHVVYNPKDPTLYVNGNPITISSSTGTYHTDNLSSSAKLDIGRLKFANGQNFEGSITDIQVFNYTLTESQVKDLYDSYGTSGTNGLFQDKLLIYNPPTALDSDNNNELTSGTELNYCEIIGPSGAITKSWTVPSTDLLEHPIPAGSSSGTYIAKLANSSNVLAAPALYIDLGNSLTLSGNTLSYTAPTGVSPDTLIDLYKDGVKLHENISNIVDIGSPGIYHVVQGNYKSNTVRYEHLALFQNFGSADFVDPKERNISGGYSSTNISTEADFHTNGWVGGSGSASDTITTFKDITHVDVSHSEWARTSTSTAEIFNQLSNICTVSKSLPNGTYGVIVQYGNSLNGTHSDNKVGVRIKSGTTVIAEDVKTGQSVTKPPETVLMFAPGDYTIEIYEIYGAIAIDYILIYNDNYPPSGSGSTIIFTYNGANSSHTNDELAITELSFNNSVDFTVTGYNTKMYRYAGSTTSPVLQTMTVDLKDTNTTSPLYGFVRSQLTIGEELFRVKVNGTFSNYTMNFYSVAHGCIIETSLLPNLLITNNILTSTDLPSGTTSVELYKDNDKIGTSTAIQNVFDRYVESDPVPTTPFNSATGMVAIDGDTMVLYSPPVSNKKVYVCTYDPSSSSWKQTAEIDEIVENSYFGYKCDISGDTLVIGATHAPNPSNGYGQIYIYTRDYISGVRQTTWTYRHVFSGTTNSSFLGREVKIKDDTIVVGAPGFSSYIGKINIYTRDTPGDLTSNWTERATFTGDTGGDNFGHTIDIDDDFIVVGSPGASKISLFKRNTPGNLTSGWTKLSQVLTASDANGAGKAVALDGDTIISSAGLTGSNAAIYVFTRDNPGDLDSYWTQSAKAVPSIPLTNESAFGDWYYSLAIKGDTFVAGSYKNEGKGTVHIFTRDTPGMLNSNWSEKTKLEPSDRIANNYFGISVDINKHVDFGTVVAGGYGGPGIVKIYTPKYVDNIDFSIGSSGIYQSYALNTNSKLLGISSELSVIKDIIEYKFRYYKLEFDYVGTTSNDLRITELGLTDSLNSEPNADGEVTGYTKYGILISGSSTGASTINTDYIYNGIFGSSEDVTKTLIKSGSNNTFVYDLYQSKFITHFVIGYHNGNLGGNIINFNIYGSHDSSSWNHIYRDTVGFSSEATADIYPMIAYPITISIQNVNFSFDGTNKFTLSNIQTHAPKTTKIVIKLNKRTYNTIELTEGHSVDSTIFYIYASGVYQAWFYDKDDVYITQTTEVFAEVSSSAFPVTVTENSSDGTKVDFYATFKPMVYDSIQLLDNTYNPVTNSSSEPIIVTNSILDSDLLDLGKYVLKFTNTTVGINDYHSFDGVIEYTYTFSINLAGNPNLYISKLELFNTQSVQTTYNYDNFTYHDITPGFGNSTSMKDIIENAGTLKNNSGVSTASASIRVNFNSTTIDSGIIPLFTYKSNEKLSKFIIYLYHSIDEFTLVPQYTTSNISSVLIYENGIEVFDNKEPVTNTNEVHFNLLSVSPPSPTTSYILDHDGFDKLSVSMSSPPNIVKLLRADTGSTDFKYIGNMTYDGSSKATFTIDKLGEYKAAIDAGTYKEVETSSVIPFASGSGGPVGLVQSPTFTSGATSVYYYNVSITVSNISSDGVTLSLLEGHGVGATLVSSNISITGSPTTSDNKIVTILHSDVSLSLDKNYTVRLSLSETDTDYPITVAKLPPRPVQEIRLTSGNWYPDWFYSYRANLSSGSKYFYTHTNEAGNDHDTYGIQYDYITKIWEDGGIALPDTLTRNGDQITFGVYGTFTDPYYVAPSPDTPVTYLGFYGEPLSGITYAQVYISELELTTINGIVINNSNKDTYIELLTNVKSTFYDGAESDPNFVVDGNYGWPFLTFINEAPNNAIYFYLKLKTPLAISSGKFWTHTDSTDRGFGVGKIYGLDDIVGLDLMVESNWNYVCDLTNMPAPSLFPEVNLTSSTDQGHVVSDSSHHIHTGSENYYYDGWYAFNGIVEQGTIQGWVSEAGKFKTDDGSSNTAADPSLTIKFPYKIRVYSFIIHPRAPGGEARRYELPKTGTLEARNGLDSYVLIKTFDSASASQNIDNSDTHTVNATTAYEEFRLTINSVYGPGATASTISEMKFFGWRIPPPPTIVSTIYFLEGWNPPDGHDWDKFAPNNYYVYKETIGYYYVYNRVGSERLMKYNSVDGFWYDGDDGGPDNPHNIQNTEGGAIIIAHHIDGHEIFRFANPYYVAP